MANPLRKFKDEAARAAFGMTKAEAQEKGICIECKKKPLLRTEAEKREYKISALCGPCFDVLFSDE